MAVPITEIQKIIDYLHDDEKGNYEAASANDKTNHIFKDIQKVKTWLSQMSGEGYWTKLFKRINY